MASNKSPYYLYRWFDKNDVLLYVGISADPTARRKSHEKSSWWSHWGARFEVEADSCSPQRSQAEVFEARVIRSENPIFNTSRALRPRERIVGYLTGRGYSLEDYERRLPPEMAPKAEKPKRPVGRPSEGDKIETRLPPDLLAQANALAKEMGLKRSRLIALAVQEFVKARV